MESALYKSRAKPIYNFTTRSKRDFLIANWNIIKMIKILRERFRSNEKSKSYILRISSYKSMSDYGLSRLRKMFKLTSLYLSIVLTGCGLTQSKQEAEKIVAKHFQIISTNGFDAALSDYGRQFFVKTSKEQWSAVLSRVSSKLGKFQHYVIISWLASKNAGIAGSGTYVELKCQTSYSLYTAQERFTLFKSAEDSDYKIIAHNISSDRLLKE